MKQGLILKNFFCHRACALSIDNHLIKDKQEGKIEAKDDYVACPYNFIHSETEKIKIGLYQPNSNNGNDAADNTDPCNGLAKNESILN